MSHHSTSQTSRHLKVDVAVIGGGLGGVAAALAAVRRGRRVVMTEPTTWVGGQLSAQGVPPDEHPWIEQFGCTASYRRLRNQIRAYYREWFPLTVESAHDPQLNPGRGRVSKLCHDPRVALAVMESMLSPWVGAGRLTVLTEHVPVEATVDEDLVTSVTVRSTLGRGDVVIEADYFLDATETGDLLPLTGTEFVTGFESRAETGEPSAPEAAQPDNVQAVSVCFAVDHQAGADHVIDKPAEYEHFRDFEPPNWSGRLISWLAPDPRTGVPVERTFNPNPVDDGPILADQSQDAGDKDLWLFRRIAARSTFVPGFLDSDITLVNWPMIDYVEGVTFGPDREECERHLSRARQLSLSMLYWMQTEAPRSDGGVGFPGLRLRGDLFGTTDGLAVAPYVREGRRLLAQCRITEQDVSLASRGDRGAVSYPDSVGVGAYRIDLHPSTGGDGYIDVANCPFEIPLRALIPQRVRNVIAAGKCLGTTHITNGCYRLHPVEWNTGEVAGLLAAYCLESGTSPQAVTAHPDNFDDFARVLDAEGVERKWPEVKAY